MQNLLYAVHATKIAAEVIDGEAILINVETGTYYNTEGIGGWAWERCVEEKSLEAMVELGLRQFDVTAETIAKDLRAFFLSLQEEDLLSASEVASATERTDGLRLEGRLPYATPKLVIYRDLKDLLALDPPMPRLGGTGATVGAANPAKR